MISPDITEAQFIAKYQKYESKVVAVAFEAFNRLGSDIFTIIQAENLELKINPFDVTLTTCFVGEDEGPHDGNIMIRNFHIGGIFDLYSLSTLIYQMLKNYDISSALNMLSGIVILKISVNKGGKLYEIEPSIDSTLNDGVMEWLKQFGIRCDTDEFLFKKSRKSKDDCVVSMRYSVADGYVRPTYHWPQERQFLLISGDYWKRINDDLDYQVIIKYGGALREGELMYAGIAIPNTGLMYLCPITVGIEIFGLDSMEIMYTLFDRHDDTVYMSTDLITLEGPDHLYMALYLPQMLDVNRFLYQRDPIKIDIECIRDKFLCRRGRYDIKTPKDENQGIEMDMFGMLANIMINERIYDIRDENARTIADSKLAQLIGEEGK